MMIFSFKVFNSSYCSASFANRVNQSRHELPPWRSRFTSLYLLHLYHSLVENFSNWNNTWELVIKNIQIVVGLAISALWNPDFLLRIWVVCFLYLFLAIDSNHLKRRLKLPLMVPLSYHLPLSTTQPNTDPADPNAPTLTTNWLAYWTETLTGITKSSI